ncbi:hypothetical protein BOX15_Mlig013437g1, partial [Macrostomum lignano]
AAMLNQVGIATVAKAKHLLILVASAGLKLAKFGGNASRPALLMQFNPANKFACLLARLHLRFVWHCQMLWRYAIGRRDQYLMPDQLSVVYESDNFIVINKEFDLSVNTASRWFNPLALNTQVFLAKHHRADPTAYHWYRFCHQIDHATSGLILLAYSQDAAMRASKAFLNRRVLKQYLAIVWGHFDTRDHVTVDRPIGWDRLDIAGSGDLRKHMVTETHYRCLDPKPAFSQVVPLERGLYNGLPATKVLLLLKHGRTHQLRVHTSCIGHPIVGDVKYSRREADFRCHRMMLHAYRLQARLPRLSETIDCQAEDPFVPESDANWQPESVQNDYAVFKDCARILESGEQLTVDKL